MQDSLLENKIILGSIQKENKREKAGKGHCTMEMTFRFYLNSKVLNFLKSSFDEILSNFVQSRYKLWYSLPLKVRCHRSSATVQSKWLAFRCSFCSSCSFPVCDKFYNKKLEHLLLKSWENKILCSSLTWHTEHLFTGLLRLASFPPPQNPCALEEADSTTWASRALPPRTISRILSPWPAWLAQGQARDWSWTKQLEAQGFCSTVMGKSLSSLLQSRNGDKRKMAHNWE